MPCNPFLLATDIPPIPAARRLAQRYDGRHGPLIDLAQAVPGDPPPQMFLDRLARTAGDPASTTYGPIFGDEGLRDALAGDIRRIYGGTVEVENVAVTAGCNQAFFVTLMSLARAGDEVILPTPWYFNHKMTADMLGVRAVPLPCTAEDGFVPRPEAAAALVSDRTRAIVLVSPNNPTGAVYPAETLRAFLNLARERRLALILDETYRDFLPDGAGRPHRLFEDPHWADALVHLYSFSKSYAIPGHRLGATVASAAVLEQLAKVLDSLQICPPRTAQSATAWAVGGLADWRVSIRTRINERAARFRQALAGTPEWSVAAIGAYFAYLRHPFPEHGDAIAERLASKAGLLVLPGAFFGPGQDGFLRVAFANVDAARLDEAARRFALLL